MLLTDWNFFFEIRFRKIVNVSYIPKFLDRKYKMKPGMVSDIPDETKYYHLFIMTKTQLWCDQNTKDHISSQNKKIVEIN